MGILSTASLLVASIGVIIIPCSFGKDLQDLNGSHPGS